MKELCSALAEAERGGHAFIALKWFRDSFLPRKAYRWNQNPESRQSVLAEAIQNPAANRVEFLDDRGERGRLNQDAESVCCKNGRRKSPEEHVGCPPHAADRHQHPRCDRTWH